MLSDHAMKLPTQGVAVVHNFIAGAFTAVGRGVDNGTPTKPSPRYTPYHMHHRTEVAGFMTILHGDCRFYNNIFVQQKMRKGLVALQEQWKNDEWSDGNLTVGTIPYEAYPTYEEYVTQFEGYCGMGSKKTDRYYNPLPVWAAGNAFFNGAKAMTKETDALVDNDHEVTVELVEKDGEYTFKTNVYDFLPKTGAQMISTEVLGMAFEPEQLFENPDGSPIVFNEDFFGEHRAVNPQVGPFEAGADAIVVAKHR